MFKVLVLLLFPVLVYGSAADESSFYTPLAPFHCPQIEGDSETKGIFYAHSANKGDDLFFNINGYSFHSPDYSRGFFHFHIPTRTLSTLIEPRDGSIISESCGDGLLIYDGRKEGSVTRKLDFSTMMQTETRLSECLDSERCGSMQCFRISKINPNIIFTLVAEGERGSSGTSIAVSCLGLGRTSLINFELGGDIIYPSFLALSADENVAYIRFSNVLERGIRPIWYDGNKRCSAA